MANGENNTDTGQDSGKESKSAFVNDVAADKESRTAFIDKVASDKESRTDFITKISKDDESKRAFAKEVAADKYTDHVIENAAVRKADDHVKRYGTLALFIFAVVNIFGIQKACEAKSEAETAKNAVHEFKLVFDKKTDNLTKEAEELTKQAQELLKKTKEERDEWKTRFDEAKQFEKDSRSEALAVMRTSHSMIQQSILDLRNASTKLTDTQHTLAGTMMIRDMQHDRRIRDLDKKEDENTKSLLSAQDQLNLARIELGQVEEAGAENSRKLEAIRKLYAMSVGAVAADSFLLRVDYPASQVILPAMVTGGGVYEMEVSAQSIKKNYIELVINVRKPTSIPSVPLYRVFVKEGKPIKGTPYSVYLDQVDSRLFARNSALVKIIPTR